MLSGSHNHQQWQLSWSLDLSSSCVQVWSLYAAPAERGERTERMRVMVPTQAEAGRQGGSADCNAVMVHTYVSRHDITSLIWGFEPGSRLMMHDSSTATGSCGSISEGCSLLPLLSSARQSDFWRREQVRSGAEILTTLISSGPWRREVGELLQPLEPCGWQGAFLSQVPPAGNLCTQVACV